MKSLFVSFFAFFVSLQCFADVPVEEKLRLWLEDESIPENKFARISIIIETRDNYAHFEDLQDVMIALDEIAERGFRDLQGALRPRLKLNMTKAELRELVERDSLTVEEIRAAGELGTLQQTAAKIEKIQRELFQKTASEGRTATEAELQEAYSKVLEIMKAEFDLKHDLNEQDMQALAAVLIDKTIVQGRLAYPLMEWIKIARLGRPEPYAFLNALDKTYSQGDRVLQLPGYVSLRLKGLGFSGPENYRWLYRHLPEEADAAEYLLARIHPSLADNPLPEPDSLLNGDWRYERIESSPDYAPRFELILGDDLQFEDVAPPLYED